MTAEKKLHTISLDMVFVSASKQHIFQERQKAKKLKNTSWWKKKISTGQCYLCHNIFEKKELTMEHLIPLSRGGYSNKNNIVVCCKLCNSQKKHDTILETRLKQLKKQNT